MSEKIVTPGPIIPIETTEPRVEGSERPNNLGKKFQRAIDFMTEKALETPEPITIKGKDGEEITIENRGGFWVL